MEKKRIKRNTLVGKVNQGGKCIIDIEGRFSAAKASWVDKILDDKSLIHKIK